VTTLALIEDDGAAAIQVTFDGNEVWRHRRDTAL
jgi:hypothetical protein